MKYIVLLRGINVGGNRKIEMKQLKMLCESLGYIKVSTYINSGNIIFESMKESAVIRNELEAYIEKTFGFSVPVLVKTAEQMQNIAESIPAEWQNDTEYKTDVAYLFDEIDSETIIEKLPVKFEYVDMRYTHGALFWRVSRTMYNKSQLNKLAGHTLYQLMTVRNVNTARILGTK